MTTDDLFGNLLEQISQSSIRLDEDEEEMEALQKKLSNLSEQLLQALKQKKRKKAFIESSTEPEKEIFGEGNKKVKEENTLLLPSTPSSSTSIPSTSSSSSTTTNAPTDFPINSNNNNSSVKMEETEEGIEEEEEEDDESNRYAHHISNTEGKRKETEEEPPVTCAVYIWDIVRGVSNQELHDAFCKYGNVFEASVVKNRFTGETKGYGFARYYNMEDVYRCLLSDDLPKFEDEITHIRRQVRVKLADPKNVLLITNLPMELSEDKIVKKLNEATGVVLIKFEYKKNRKLSSIGKGRATYKDHHSALTALQKLQQQSCVIDGNIVGGMLSDPKIPSERMIVSNEEVKTLFVKNLASGVTQQQLHDLFEEDRKRIVDRVVIPLDVTTRAPLNHAFVYFTERKDAEYCKDKYNGIDLDGKRIEIEWCRPKSKVLSDSQRKRENYSHHHHHHNHNNGRSSRSKSKR
eukprot:TRINITY_DN2853_c0_g1_i4.p1 TRINITY_DN2853_c0_g1~~TRINITY_DN2853_c0_g1_i4.p1  ORF type:complete len:529 (-),score=178.57 TRINITY_DN2853_c0_g1_i4:1915-3303(-)